MKRSEVSKGLDALKIPRWEKAQIFDILERAGATWDPEEPELPGRIKSTGRGFAVIDQGGDPDSRWDGCRVEDIYAEAESRYNAVGRILEEMLGPGRMIDYDSGKHLLSIFHGEGVTR